MEDQTAILITILEWAWVGLIAVIMWMFKRQNRIENSIQERRGVVNTAVAVLEASQECLRQEFEKDSKRNTQDHQTIISRIDTHHDRVMGRLDSLLKIAKNGN